MDFYGYSTFSSFTRKTRVCPGGMIGGRYLGHWLQYDADAAQRSVNEMHDFLQAQFAK